MTDHVLRTNAMPVYAFLSHIMATRRDNATLRGKKILDCGAGGVLPPLTLFYQHGCEIWGIDNADEPLQKAHAFCDAHGIDIHLQKGDMRHLPFDDELFDYVYEHYSMCHLSKQETMRAIREMSRVLKKGGLCFCGVISRDTWPKSDFGHELKPGEFWTEACDDNLPLHSMFTDEETETLVSGWEILSKEKRVIFLREAAQNTSFETWKDLYKEVQDQYTLETWEAMYGKRIHVFQYTHVYFFLRKPV